MDFTIEQRDAIYTHDKNLIVIAGAGSGKTRVLVERYLSLLDAHPDWPLNALVAVTFTKKAAEEMKDRVRQALEKKAVEDDRWNNLLVQIDSARIDTIHGLCANILRANAAEARIDPEFTILDELDSLILREGVIRNVFSELILDGGDEIALFIEYKHDEIQAILQKPDILTANLRDLPDDLFGYWYKLWQANVSVYLQGFLHQVYTIGTVVPAQGDKLGNNWQLCLDNLDYLVDSNDPVECFNSLKNIAAIKMIGGSAKKWRDKQIFDDAKFALASIRDIAKQTVEDIGNPPDKIDQHAARLLPLWISLIQRVSDAYNNEKYVNAQLDFNDLELLTRDLLVNFPHVRDRYRGTEFKQLLVDEFQDTNAVQWEIVQALADLNHAGSLFVVGDPKQSIYAFRGADVSVFGKVRKQIENAGGKHLLLSTSFRTHMSLVSAFNTIFSRFLIRDESSLVADYQVEMEAMSAFRKIKPDDFPALQFLCINKVEYDEEGQPLKEGLNASERRQWEAHEIAQRLQEMILRGVEIFDKENQANRPMEFGDVAILFQSLSNVTVYEDVFKAVDLPFVTLSGRGYYNKQEVWDLLNLLQSVYNPTDNLALASVLRSPIFGLSDDTLFSLRLLEIDEEGEPIPLWQALDYPEDQLLYSEYKKVKFARDCLYDLRSLAGRVTIFELLSYALERTGYIAILTGLPDGIRRRGNVEKLLEKSQSLGKTSLGEFSQYLRELSIREAREGEASVDASGMVNIMTVHASKGLEYPVIVLADATWCARGGNANILTFDGNNEIACKVYSDEESKNVPTFRYKQIAHIHKLRDDAERLRLLYVAATRAQDYLIISGQVNQNKKSEWSASGWLDVLLDAIEIKDELLVGMDDTFSFGEIDVRLTVPRMRADADASVTDQIMDLTNVDLSNVEPEMPPLLRPIPTNPELKARHLAVTQIADLGCIEQSDTDEERQFYRERFVRQVFYDAPSHIESVSGRNDYVTAKQIGDIVHEALRYGHIDKNRDALRDLVSHYAWRFGITNEYLHQEAIDRAMILLDQYKQSQLYDWVSSASEVYHELPFIYALQNHVVHGVIDLLFKTHDGRWILADYKTSKGNPNDLAHHARRYHLQLGIYAAAVTEQLEGIVPDTYIHYLRYNQLVKIYPDQWKQAFQKNLDIRIRDVIQKTELI